MNTDTEVIIVGGGVVGATLACALGTEKVCVTLLEARRPPVAWPSGSMDERVFAITRASEKLFQALGIWDGIALRGMSPFRQMHVWEAGGEGVIHFDSAEICEPVLGHIIEQRVLLAALWARLEQLPSVQIISPAQPEAMRCSDEGVNIDLRGGQKISARLVAGADGAASQVRAWSGISTRAHDYQQQSIVATVATEKSHAQTAWQRFLADGPLAFLPLHDGRSSIVWTTTPEQAERLLALGNDEFCAALGSAFDHTLGKILSCSARFSFALQRAHAQQYVTNRVALLGDAAHSVHPLAGQGVNLGLLDVAALVEVLCDTKRKKRDLGALANLRRYERWRKGGNLGMAAALDGCKALFATENPPLSVARKLGMDAVEGFSPLKNLIMRHAGGLSGDLPRLSRGMQIGADA